MEHQNNAAAQLWIQNFLLQQQQQQQQLLLQQQQQQQQQQFQHPHALPNFMTQQRPFMVGEIVWANPTSTAHKGNRKTGTFWPTQVVDPHQKESFKLVPLPPQYQKEVSESKLQKYSPLVLLHFFGTHDFVYVPYKNIQREIPAHIVLMLQQGMESDELYASEKGEFRSKKIKKLYEKAMEEFKSFQQTGQLPANWYEEEYSVGGSGSGGSGGISKVNASSSSTLNDHAHYIEIENDEYLKQKLDNGKFWFESVETIARDDQSADAATDDSANPNSEKLLKNVSKGDHTKAKRDKRLKVMRKLGLVAIH